MLKLENLSISVEDKKIIDNIDLDIKDGEVHLLMGPNGVGKSTICKAIIGDPDYTIQGKIIYNDEDITNSSPESRAIKGIFMLYQNPVEIPGVTNAEMLRSALTARGIKESVFDLNKRMTEACNTLGIDKSYIHHNINENMSGGEKKKNEMLHIEVLKPNLILLDELDSGLDIDSLKSLAMELDNYRKRNNASILMITHHTNILEYITPDAVHIIDDGHIVTSGSIDLAKKIEKYGFKGAF